MLINPAAVSALLVTNADPSITTGTPLSFIVTPVDRFSNPQPNYAGTIAFRSSDSSFSNTTYTFNSTTARKGYYFCCAPSTSIVFRTPGAQTFQAYDVANAALVSGQNTVNVTPAPGVTLTVKMYLIDPAGSTPIEGAPPGTVVNTVPATTSITQSSTSVAVAPNTPYIVRSTVPAGYSVSTSQASPPSKENSFTTPANGVVNVTFYYTRTINLVSWSGDFDPPSGTAGLGQWGHVHCGEAARQENACPTEVVNGQNTCNPAHSCAIKYDGNMVPHGETEDVSTANNLAPTSGRIQIRSDNVRYPGHSARFEVHAGDDWAGALFRNELTSNDARLGTSYGEGQEGYFAWSTFIEAARFEDMAPNFQTLTQWHHSSECGSQPLGLSLTKQANVAGLPNTPQYALALSSQTLYMDPGCDAPCLAGMPTGSGLQSISFGQHLRPQVRASLAGSTRRATDPYFRNGMTSSFT